MKKRGISPLIATVLVIGFTIVLASMVMIWGGDIFQKYKSQTETEAMTKLTCATKINLNIKDACDLGTSIRVKLENQADQNINSLIYRAISPSGAAIDIINEPLAPFEVKTFYPKYFAIDQFYTKPNKIELLPRVIIEGKEQTCPGTSKEIKPCLTLPSLNSLADWTITGATSSGLLNEIKSFVEAAQFNDEIGIYASGPATATITITSKEFIIPPEANYLFARYLASSEGEISYELKIGENTYSALNLLEQEQVGGVTIGYKFKLSEADEGEGATLTVTKTNGGTLAITNLAYIIQ